MITYNVPPNAAGVTLNNGDVMNIDSGGTATDTTVNSGGNQYVFSGGSASGTVLSGGTETVYSGGSETGATVYSGGIETVSAGGSLTSAVVNSGGVDDVYGSAKKTNLKGGAENIEYGGSASGTVVNSNSVETVSSGGYLYSATIDGGTENIEYGGSASSTVLNKGTENIYSVGSETGATVGVNGVVTVYAGGLLAGATISTGGKDTIYGSARSTVLKGGDETVKSGGSATGVIISSGGIETVSSGGLLSGATLNSHGTIDVYGSASGTVLNGGKEFVFSGGSETGAAIGSGAIETVSSGGLLSNATLSSGGTVSVAGGGTARGASTGLTAIAGTITNGGTISGSTYAVDITDDSTLNILAGAVFEGKVQDDGTGTLNLAGATAGTLDLGGSFSGFEHITFGSAAWTLEGTTSELANGETISGLAGGDALVLDSFAATAASYISGTGLVLSNASFSETIALGTAPAADDIFTFSSDGTNTTLFTEIATISTYVPHGVSLNNGTYAAMLSITSTGTINGGSYGAAAAASTVTNSGDISGASNAVYDFNGSMVINTRGGTISSAGTGIYANAGTVTNSGSIYGGNNGVTADNASTVTNVSSGTISSNGSGVYAGDSTVTNSGSISGNTGVSAHSGSTVTNYGSIHGNSNGVYASDSTLTNTGAISGNDGVRAFYGSTVTNSGTLSGNYGVYAKGSTITNTSSGAISGNEIGVDAFNSSTVANYGSISGGEWGVLVSRASTITNTGSIHGLSNGIVDFYGSAVTNASSAAIYGGNLGIQAKASTVINSGSIHGVNDGVYAYAGSTITNSGAIYGSRYAVQDHGGSTLNVLAGAVFEGKVTDDGTGLLILAGTIAGSLDMGGTFSGFENISFGSAAWTLEGSSSELANGETISGFTFGDTIALDGFTATSETYVSGTGLELGNGVSEVTIEITGSFSGDPFSFSDTPQGTEIFLCFQAGTRIATLAGEAAVEELAIGDRVVTRFGGVRKIKWIGRQRYRQPFLGQQRERLPVRIMPGALGDGLPLRELLVSPGHSLLLGEVLVLAKHLINGVTITQDEVEEIDYYNIEFDTHDCVLAEGSWAESYADAPGQRAQFHNAATFHALYLDHVETQALTLCAPRHLSGPELAAALAPIVAQAAGMAAPGTLLGYVEDICANGFIQGWAVDEAHPALPVSLEILQNGAVIGKVLARGERPDVAAAGFGTGGGFTFQTAFALVPAGITVRRAADGAVLGLAHPLRQSLVA